uniref:Uncharacterized protein n=1 Tax=Knipowitschia caucasica TaxID=637954 RepID=A0AAV2L466_KNICA
MFDKAGPTAAELWSAAQEEGPFSTDHELSYVQWDKDCGESLPRCSLTTINNMVYFLQRSDSDHYIQPLID